MLPSRYGLNPDDLRRADAIEVVVGQGAKPGGGGMLLGQKITERVAKMRNLPVGIDQRSACRHPDWTGPDDLTIKIQELREITDWEKPIYVKVGATRTYYDVALAVKAGADVVVRRRHAGRHGRHPGRLHRACRHSHPAGGAPGGASRCRSWTCTARCSSSSPAASAAAPTWPRPWRWAPTRSPSARQR